MKTITEYIVEKLKVSKSTYNKEVLNTEINNLDELREVLMKYFGSDASKISKGDSRWKLSSDTRDGIRVSEKFNIKFLGNDNATVTKELHCAKHNDKFLMQARVRNYKGKMEVCPVVGYVRANEFVKGTNLLTWLENIKDCTENRKIGREINLMVLFGFME